MLGPAPEREPAHSYRRAPTTRARSGSKRALPKRRRRQKPPRKVLFTLEPVCVVALVKLGIPSLLLTVRRAAPSASQAPAGRGMDPSQRPR